MRSDGENVKGFLAKGGASVMLAVLVGCMGSQVTWIEKASSQSGETGGNYHFLEMSNGGLKNQVDLKKVVGSLTKHSKNCAAMELPVRVSIEEKERREANGVVASVNNLFSVCTLGIWPYVESFEYPVSLKVSSPTDESETSVVFGSRKWSSFLLPIAALPCPGWGDWRGSASSIDADGFYSRCEEEAIADLLTKDFYERSSSKYQQVLDRIAISVKKRPNVSVDEDIRPVFLIDPKDVHVRCRGENVDIDVEGVVDLMEDSLKNTDLCRVLTKRSIERSLREQALFNMLSSGSEELTKFVAPAYRVEIAIERYKFSQETKQEMEKRKHTFKKASVRVKNKTEVVADVQIVIKVIDLKSGHLYFSENLQGECRDESVASSFISRKGGKTKGGKMLNTERRYMQTAVGKVMSEFANRVKGMQKFSVISCSRDGMLTIDGTDRVFKAGDRVSLFKLGEVTISQRTGRTTYSETPIAEAVVENASSSGTILRIQTILDSNISGEIIARRKR